MAFSSVPAEAKGAYLDAGPLSQISENDLGF